MLIQISNLYDASTSTTTQRQRNEVYQTPRFSSPDPYRDCQTGVAVSRHLRKNDSDRPVFSDSTDLSLSTAFDGELTIGNTVSRCKAPVAKRSSALRPTALVATLGRPLLAAESVVDLASSGIPPSFRRLSQSVFPQCRADASFHPCDAIKDMGVLSQR